LRRTIRLTTLGVFCLLSLCVASQAPARPPNPDGAAPAQSSAGTVYYCASSWHQSVVYFSAPFETDELNRTNIQEAYSQFLKQKYSYADGASSIVCSISQSLTSAQSDKGGDEDSVKRAAHSVVETAWKYRGPTGTVTATAAAPNRSASPAASHAPPAPARNSVPTPPPQAASAAPSANPAPTPVAASANSAGGHLTAMNICFSHPGANPSDPNYKTEYLTSAFEVDVDALRPAPVLEPAFSAYLKAKYQYPSAAITCQPIWTVTEAKTVQKKISDDRGRAKLSVIDTGWRYGQPPLAPGQSGFDPLAQGPGGLDLAQHHLTTYYCTLVADGGTSWVRPPGPSDATRYVSPIFQADWDSVAVSNAWYAYIRDHYVHDLDQAVNGAAFGTGSRLCSAQSPAQQAMLHQGDLRVDMVARHIVSVDWTDTPAQAAAARVAAPPAFPAAPATASTASSTGGSFISCSTSGGAGIDTYYTGVFQTTHPVKRLGNGGFFVDQSVLDRFYAYLTQKGYKFKPGSNYGCDVSLTEAATKAAQHKRAYEGNPCSNCGKVVETGWKDE
jgi:hypothetical protein